MYNRDRFVSVRALSLASTPVPEGARESDRTEFWRELAVDALLRALHDPRPDPSTAAALALGKADASEAVLPLCRLLLERSTERTLRESAALGLGMIGGETAAEALRGILTSRREDRRLRAFAAVALGFTGRRELLPFLVEATGRSKEEPDVRAGEFLGLGLLGDRVATPMLLDAIRDRAGRLRIEERAIAIRALGMLRDRVGLATLLAAVRADRAEIRRSAYLALGSVVRPSDGVACRVLVRALAYDRDARCRAYAAIALGRTGTTRAAGALSAMMDGSSVSLRGFGALGLALLVHRNGDEELRTRVSDHLRRRLARGRLASDLEGATITALGLLRDLDARPLVRRQFEEAGDPRRRGYAAVALGLMGDRDALPALRGSLAEERDPWLRREVVLALGLLRDSDSVRTLTEMVRSGRTEYGRANAALALGRTGSPAAARGMIELLGSRSASGPTRGMAAVALGYILDRRTVPQLSRVVEDLDYMIRLGMLHELLTIL